MIFKLDSLSGKADYDHRTNVMHLQPVEDEETNTSSVACGKKYDLTQKLKETCETLSKVQQYHCPRGATREPPVRDFVEAPICSTKPQQTRSVIHALIRSNADFDRPEPEDQRVPAYSGFQACVYDPIKKSKPYYQASYPEPPSKSDFHHVMLNLLKVMKEKNIPFFFLVGDLPTYKNILSLK